MPHQKPADSPDHRYIRELAQKAGHEPLASGQLFWALNAPPKLTAFVQIAHNLREILRLFRERRYADLQFIGLEEWHAALQWFASETPRLIQELGSHLNKPPTRARTREPTHPLRMEGMVRHSLYTALWNIHEDSGWQARYRLLQGHLLLTQIELLRVRNIYPATYADYAADKPILGPFSSSVEEACRRLRDLSTNAYILKLPRFHVEAPHGDFVRATCAQYREPADADKSPLIQKIALFVHHAYVDRKTRSGRSAGTYKRSARQFNHDGNLDWEDQTVRSIAVGDPADPDDDWGTQAIIRDRIPNPEIEEADLDPDENSGSNEVYISEFGCKERAGGPVTQRLAALGQVRRRVMDNQLLRHSWAQLTLWEVAQLVKLCGETLKQPANRSAIAEDPRQREECAALLLVILWTGSPLERARTLEILDKGGKGSAALAYDPEVRMWQTTPSLPRYLTEPNEAAVAASRPRIAHMRIADFFNVGARLTKLRNSSGSPSSSPFLCTQEEHERGIRDLLKKLPAGHRVTLAKVENFLFHVIAQGPGDVADAALITGRRHHLAQTLLHYTTPELQDLQKIYRGAVEGVIREIFKEAYHKEPPQLTEREHMVGKHVGSRLCPKPERIQAMVEECRRRLYKSYPERSLMDWATYHNRFTVYTSQYVGYATGYRAITDPSFTEDRIDPDTGLGVISDKDAEDDYYNTRLVWLPEGVRTQIKHYRVHWHYVVSALALRDPESVPDEFFFLLKGGDKGTGLTADPVRPKTMTQVLKDLLPLPLNVNRRFLRTELKLRGCPIEVINCFMGHWQRGEEPWGRYSTFSTSDYVRELRPHIEEILKNLGWKPVRSRFT